MSHFSLEKVKGQGHRTSKTPTIINVAIVVANNEQEMFQIVTNLITPRALFSPILLP